ncbi:OmpP1/FadL family transporter [Rhizobium pusense]|jgi:long-chain fatty acid transport protein|uniref:Long-chain fatty acid transport protein n=4 Tax=Hyphomicrobiales TaxID=356 RepID=A0A1S9EMC2_9HYPH|nr:MULTISPECIES: OmpP1/FadL family transporter [Rhizobium/Agrobacterium group]AMD59298.1 long-chain fatty acid transporter [Agrobacterium tumefaciens]AUC09858.1 long-chain fatty acid transporter [Rhizobium sp. Y9]EKJ95413.1 aromatic hydrocarbon degradation membrane protein [Bradyrhizobium lupini HPC(L)]KIV61322.1 Long-chain fatty acid transport protein [Rhizobium sp. UR51a]MBB2905182.1 long-chain fatty acid transport protein [Rhizobium sp. RAS22]MDP9733395.1 long-chain fatty acid transport pr
MAKTAIFRGAVCFAVSIAAVTPSLAGGLERGGYNIDLLFDPSDYVLDSSATFVAPQRKVENARDNPLKSGPLPASWSRTADDSENFWSTRIGAKASIGDFGDCMFDYSQPWGAHLNPGIWQGSSYNIETKVKSHNYATTCRVKFDLGKGDFSIIGGGFYQELSGYKYRQVLGPAVLGLNPAWSSFSGVGKLEMEGDGWGWRAGMAYEIPEIAFRASLVYNSAVDHDLTGFADVRGIPQTPPSISPTLAKYGGKLVPIYGSVSMPDSIELKVQSGIAPDWLAFGSVKWTDWSQIQVIPFCAVGTSPCVPSGADTLNTLDLFYRDGWTISGGVGHKFNEQWSGAVSLTWDRGTSTVIGTQTDTWTLGTQIVYSPNKNIEFKIAGALGLLTSGSSSINGGPCGAGFTCGNEAGYDFGNDLVAAISTGVKVKF